MTQFPKRTFFSSRPSGGFFKEYYFYFKLFLLQNKMKINNLIRRVSMSLRRIRCAFDQFTNIAEESAKL